ncbi:hypothetical protein GCM10029964_019270 [Kibdelosporangium lantanae]
MFVLLTTVITVTVWQLAATRRARAAAIRDQEFRLIAERAVASQESTERRLAEIERILREVE